MTQTLTRETAVGSDAAADYVARVRTIAPVVRAEAAEIEAQRTITKPVADALVAQDLHQLMVPAALGGGGLRPSEGMHVYEELAKADASTAWALMASSWGTATVLGYLDPAVAEELVKSPEGFIAAGQLLPRYKGVQVEGGYLVEGDYSFASGSDHANWIGAGFLVADEEGNLIPGENGQPQARIAIIPKSQVEFKKNWSVWGLAGTGSHDYTVPKQFVPADHTVPTFGGKANQPDVMYQLSNEFVGGLPHAPVVLGIAARALELVAGASLNKFRPNYPTPVGQADIFRIEFGRKEAELQGARLYAYDLVESAEKVVLEGGSITPEHIARMKQMLAWTHEVCADVVMFAHRWAGSLSISSTSELGRLVRDMNVATQHLLVDPKGLVDAAEVLIPEYAARSQA